MTHRFQLAVAAAALLGTGTAAFAQDTAAHPLGQHPAVLVKRQAVQIDPNRFIPAHPAGLYVIAAPSPTYDHPAVAVKRMADQAAAAVRAAESLPVAAAPAAVSTH